MDQLQITIRSSPFQFLKRLFIIEFFFAILPFFAAWILNLLFSVISDTYQRLPFSPSISLNLLTVLVFTLLQVLIIAFTFLLWYFPVYVISNEEIKQKRGNIIGDVNLVKNHQIEEISVKQGRMAKAFNYGSLVIDTTQMANQVKLKDIPQPQQYRQKISNFIGLDKPQDLLIEPKSANELIQQGEDQSVEFKSSFVWDYYQQRANKSLHEPVMKTIVAFLNSSGGYLLIGVDDSGKVLGLAPDYQTLRKANADGFETSFNMAFNKMIGVEHRQYVDVAFPTIHDVEICLIQIRPSPHPVYLQHEGAEKFFIRAGNASQSLTISQSNRYIKQHFG